MNRCFHCYDKLGPDDHEFHSGCSKQLFGITTPPILPYSPEKILELAREAVRSQVTVPGVQAKLSLDLKQVKGENGIKRFSIVGFMGEYILKPPSEHWNQLPEFEDLTMHLAELAGIKTVPHSLISMGDGSKAYITKRIDRKGKLKIHMEDMCQLTERMTEQKYQGGYEQILRAIMKYSVNPGLDAQIFFEVLLFSFITGNADMHLKNFSLIDQPELGYVLSAAYDLVPSAIILPDDKEEMALFLNGKKNKITRKDFENIFNRADLIPPQQERLFERMHKSMPAWQECILNSFISEENKQKYLTLIDKRMKRLGI